MSDLIERLRSTRDCSVCDGDGIKCNGKEYGGCGATGKVLRYDRTGTEAADEIERLRKMLSGCDWYWPEDDTSSDACADGPSQIVENIDAKPGDVFGYSRGGFVETRFYGYLEAAEDADSDDEFEVDEATRESAEAKMAAEISRRAAIAATSTEGGAHD